MGRGDSFSDLFEGRDGKNLERSWESEALLYGRGEDVHELGEQLLLSLVDPASGDGLGRASPDAGYRDREPQSPYTSGRVGYATKNERAAPDEKP